MKILLIQDVPKVGRKNEIKEVADGYGNFLVKNKKALVATPDVIAKNKNSKSKHLEELDKQWEDWQVMVEKLKTIKLDIKAKASKEGHLFGSLSGEDISQNLFDQYKISLPKNSLILDKPIKSTGLFEIDFVLNQNSDHLSRHLDAKIKLEIIPLE